MMKNETRIAGFVFFIKPKPIYKLFLAY